MKYDARTSTQWHELFGICACALKRRLRFKIDICIYVMQSAVRRQLMMLYVNSPISQCAIYSSA